MNLTPRQLETLRYIRGYRTKHGVSPTMQEIGDALGIGKVGAFDRVEGLVKKGALTRTGGSGTARNIALVDGMLPPDERPHIPGVADPVAFLKAVDQLEQHARGRVNGVDVGAVLEAMNTAREAPPQPTEIS